MRKVLLSILVLTLLLSLFILAPEARAKATPILAFRTGLGADGKFWAGGTLCNDDAEPVTQGYVVILMVTESCEPQHFVFMSSGSWLPAAVTNFASPSACVSWPQAGLCRSGR